MENTDLIRIKELLRFTQTQQLHTEALARATGEHFNVFDILGIGHYEVKTHSPMLGELLNPKGRHGQGDIFLRLFRELVLDNFGVTDFDAESKTAKLDLEYPIGPVTEDSGGRIDIVVQDGKGSAIFIENKIYAEDQPNQLKRYRKHDPKAHLFYLTLRGENPSGLSDAELKDIKCKCISYGCHIRDWLNACRKEAVCLPPVRETISQYIHLIEKLTNQTTTITMNKELITELTKDEASLAAFFTLRDAENAVQNELIARLDTQLDDLAKVFGLKRQGQLQRLSQKHDGFYFTTPGLDKSNLQIGFAFDKAGYRDFFFGFRSQKTELESNVSKNIHSAFKEQFKADKLDEPNLTWPASAWWSVRQNWNPETFEAIRSGQFATELKAKLEKLAGIARCVCAD